MTLPQPPHRLPAAGVSRARRLALAMLGLPLLCWGAAGCAHAHQPRPIDYTLSLTALTLQVAKRFPYTQELAGQFVTLELLNPRLALLPASNQIATRLDLRLATGALGLASEGMLAVDFGLRWEASDRTIRMTQPKLKSVRLDAVPPQYQNWLDRNAPRLVEALLDDYVLHRVDERELAFATGLGYEPASLQVTAQGLKVRLNPKQP